MLNRIFPPSIDNTYRGHILAIWIFVPILVMKLAMCMVAMFNARFGAEGADGIPISTFSPLAQKEFLEAFMILGLAQVMLALLGVVVLVRYRAMVPFILLFLLIEQIARRFFLMEHPIPFYPNPPNLSIGLVMIVGLFISLVLSLVGDYATPTDASDPSR